jgi:hypothetical protein
VGACIVSQVLAAEVNMCYEEMPNTQVRGFYEAYECVQTLLGGGSAWRGFSRGDHRRYEELLNAQVRGFVLINLKRGDVCCLWVLGQSCGGAGC